MASAPVHSESVVMLLLLLLMNHCLLLLGLFVFFYVDVPRKRERVALLK